MKANRQRDPSLCRCKRAKLKLFNSYRSLGRPIGYHTYNRTKDDQLQSDPITWPVHQSLRPLAEATECDR